MTDSMLMIFVLFIIIISLVGILVWYIDKSNGQMEMLIVAIKSKDVYEFKSAQTEVAEEEEKLPDEIALEDLNDRAFAKFIKGEKLVSEQE